MGKGAKFVELLLSQWKMLHYVCLGLDPEIEKMPDHLKELDPYRMLYTWAKEIIDATHDIVGAYKPNKGFWEAFGPEGLRAYEDIILYIRTNYPKVPVIADVKIGEIGKSTKAYTVMPLKRAQANAITLNPYFGEEGVKPALDQLEDGMIVLCRTSNPGGAEFQEITVMDPDTKLFMPLYQYVAMRVAAYWDKNRGNIGVVAGATNPEQLGMIRLIIGDMFMLIPGIGDQKGALEQSVMYGMNSAGDGFVINSSGGLTFKSKGADFAQVARTKTLELSAQILDARQKELVRRQSYIQMLENLGAIIRNTHVVYTSLKHGDTYVGKDKLYPDLEESDKFAAEIAQRFANDGIEAVIGPQMGGVPLARDVARALSKMTGKKVYAVYAEREEEMVMIAESEIMIPLPEGTYDRENEPDAIVLHPGDKLVVRKPSFAAKRDQGNLIKDKKTLVVDDVSTTGGSAKKSIAAARRAGAIVAGLALVCNRGGVRPQDVAWPPKMYSVINISLDAWDEKDCPECKKGTPISAAFGKGADYLASKGRR